MIDKFIKELAEKYNLSEQQVKVIVTSQFQFVRKIMTESKLRSIRLKYLGTFGVSFSKIRRVVILNLFSSKLADKYSRERKDDPLREFLTEFQEDNGK